MSHGKKIIAPVIITLGIAVYYAALVYVFLTLPIPRLIKFAVMLVSAAITVLAAVVLIQRIKEIRSGEEDDLGQY
jgi:low affinity Fe/Cu permease